MTKLKPCPFCGSEAIVFDGFPFNYYIKCKTCGVQSDDRANRDSAAKVWNKRTPDPQLVEALEKIVKRAEFGGGLDTTNAAICWDIQDIARQALADIEPDINSPNPLSEQRANPDMKEDAT